MTGDDVLDLIDLDAPTMESGLPLSRYAPLVSANAYLGAEAILPALASGADIVVTGRVADPSLFVAPLMHEYGWAHDDVDRLARGTAVGHLLECAGQLCGGYFADPGCKDIPGMADLGFPFADVTPDGDAVLSKVAGTGGRITVATASEQLLYEVTDPHGYLTPDVTADFSRVALTEAGPDRVAVRGARGRARPSQLKVSVGYLAGHVGEGEIGYAGTNAEARARLAGGIIRERLGDRFPDLRIEIIGSTSLHGRALDSSTRPYEVRLRVAGRGRSRADAAIIGDEVEALYTNGPAGGGGARKYVNEQIGIVSTLVDRAPWKAPSPFANGAPMPKLYELAHCRAGDKGNTSILSLIAYRAADYPLLARRVTTAAVAQHLHGIVRGEIRRYELPQLGALQFVCDDALDGGVTTSLSIDAHGKSLSSALLEMQVEP